MRGHGHAYSPLRVASTHDLLSHAQSEQLLMQASVIKIMLNDSFSPPIHLTNSSLPLQAMAHSNVPYEHHWITESNSLGSPYLAPSVSPRIYHQAWLHTIRDPCASWKLSVQSSLFVPQLFPISTNTWSLDLIQKYIKYQFQKGTYYNLYYQISVFYLGASPTELPDRGPTQCSCIIRIAWCLGAHVRVGVNSTSKQKRSW